MLLPTPPLNALRVFDAISRVKNITKAAEALSVTQSAASQQLKWLEEYLNTKLVKRDTTTLELTPIGARYAEKINQAFDEIRQSTQNLKFFLLRDKRISLSTPPTFAMRWLLKRLSTFQKQYADYELIVSTHPKTIDFQYEDYDAAIYYGRGDWPGLVMTKLMNSDIVLVCSAQLLASVKSKKRHYEVNDFTLIKTADPARLSTRSFGWPQWLAQYAPSIKSSSLRFLQLATPDQTLEAAMNGLGIALTPKAIVTDELNRHVLSIPFTDVLQVPEAYYLVYPKGRELNKKIVIMQNWLLGEINKMKVTV